MRILTADTKIRLNQIVDFTNWTEDAKHYEIGQISEKTGLQKCLVNGRIIWLLPKQNTNFSTESLGNSALRQLSKSAKPARTSEPLKELSIKETKKYFINMSNDWKKHPVKCPFLNNVEIRIDQKGYKHLFQTNGKQRPKKDIFERAECLPFIRDILERSGKPAEHLKDGNKESYSIVGRAKINGIDRGIKIVIERRVSGKFFYFSVNSYKKI